MIQNTNYGASKTYVNTKVDKLTTSGLKAYTHDGATQGEIDVSNTYTPSTLALRDSNGCLVAADPASGATDKTLVTANWVSQTGAGAPNNLMHTNGNETFTGTKTNAGLFIDLSAHIKNTSGSTDFCKIYRLTSNETHFTMMTYLRGGNASLTAVDIANGITKNVIAGVLNNRLGVFEDADGVRYLCCELSQNSSISTMGMIGNRDAGFVTQIYALVGTDSTGSTGMTQIWVTQ